MPAGAPSARTGLAWTTAVLILAAHAGLAVSSLALKSVTNDELSHLPAGLAAVATGDVLLNPQHPPLVKLLAGLAASTLDPELPLDSAAYRAENQWTFGRLTLFESGNDPRALLFRGRLPMVGLSVLGGLAVFLWSRRRFGDAGGLLSLSLYAFSPTVLAHGRLVTMDGAVAAGTVWTLYLWWRATGGTAAAPGSSSDPGRGAGWRRAAACGCALGLALGAKFSALLLVPILPLLDLLRNGWGGGRAWRRRAVSWLAVAVPAILVVQILYLPPEDPLRYLRDLGTLYPDYASHAPDHPVYLAGEFRPGGYPHYFLAALALKTSPVALLAWAGGLAVAAGAALRRRARWRDDLFLWLPVAVWVAVHSAAADDLGVRYMLPVYPLLAVLAGGLAPALRELLRHRARTPRLAAPALLVLGLAQATTAFSAWPDYLPYFHRIALLAGGERGGLHWLEGSNLDWGQDLARLAPWLESHGVDRVRLLYYGGGVPAAYGVQREPMLPSDWFEGPRPGVYVISAQYLVHGLYQARTEGVASDWLVRYRPSDVLGGTLFLYRFPAAPPAPDPNGDPTEEPGEPEP